jgi:calcineurin-like phosphoesterase family protein
MYEIKKESKYGYMEFTEDSNIYLISDCHFDHSNIITICNRPFKDIAEMNSIIMSNWNRVVRPDDLVIDLGDFCWSGNYLRWMNLLQRLNGKKIFVMGNHDDRKVLPKIETCYYLIKDILDIKVGKNKFTLCHYPLVEWSGSSHKHNYHLYGHTHKPGLTNKTACICVENIGYTPIKLNDILNKMNESIS